MHILVRIFTSMVLSVLLIGTIAAEAATAAAASADSWPAGRGAEHDGRSALIGIRKDWAGGLRKVWETDVLATGDLKVCASSSSPVVSQGLVVVMGRSEEHDQVFAFDAATGAKCWMQEVSAKGAKKWEGLGNGARAAPAIDGDLVFTLGAYGHLACWDLKTGAQKWLVRTLEHTKTQVPYWGVCGSPVVHGSNVLVEVGGYGQGGRAPLVLALDKATGQPAWRSADAAGSWAPLTIQKIAGREILLAWASDGLRGLDPATGKQAWQISWRTAYDCHASPPVVAGDKMFITSGYGTGCQAFEFKEQQPVALWPVNKTVSSCSSAPVVHEGHVYAFSGNGNDANATLKCIELQTGAERWSTQDFGNGTLIYLDGCLLCFSYKGKLGLVEASPAAYKKLAEQQVFETGNDPAYAAPAVAGGKVYVRYKQRLACFDLLK